MTQKKGKGRKERFEELMQQHGCTEREMFGIIVQRPGFKGIHPRTFSRWLRDETGGARAEDALRVLRDQYGSLAALREPITDPISALKVVYENVTEFQRIQKLVEELTPLMQRATSRYLAVSAYFKKAAGGE